jgi:hypothetical protein
VDVSFTTALPSANSPFMIRPAFLTNGAITFTFTNSSGLSFTVLGTTNLSLPVTNWTVLGTAQEVSSGLYQFTDSPATNFTQRFYRVRSP